MNAEAVANQMAGERLIESLCFSISFWLGGSSLVTYAMSWLKRLYELKGEAYPSRVAQHTMLGKVDAMLLAQKETEMRDASARLFGTERLAQHVQGEQLDCRDIPDSVFISHVSTSPLFVLDTRGFAESNVV